MLLPYPKVLTSTSSDRGNGKQQPATTVRFSPRTPSEHRIFYSDSQIVPTPKSLRLPNRKIYILPHVQEFLAGLDSTWEDRLMRWTLRVRNALEAGDALPLFSTAEWNLGAQTALEAGDELPPFPTAAGATPEGTDPAMEIGPQNLGASGAWRRRWECRWEPSCREGWGCRASGTSRDPSGKAQYRLCNIYGGNVP